MARALVVQVVGTRAAVVAIHEDVGTPLVDHVGHERRDRRVLELHVVAIQIDSPRVPALTLGARLEAVGVELGRDQDGDLVEQVVRRGAGRGEVAHEDQQTLTKRALASVHVGPEHDDRAPERPRLVRIAHERTTEDRVRSSRPSSVVPYVPSRISVVAPARGDPTPRYRV